MQIFLILMMTILTFSLTNVPKIFPYQAHSFNDLGIARRLMQKRVKYFKFDASLANLNSCSQYSTWKKDNQCINLPEYAEDMCCIAMRGDASSEPNFYYPFNTSSEFVSMVDNFLSEYEQQIDILFIAIDFQFSFSFSNILAQRFMYDLATLMYKYQKLHVTIKGNYTFQYDRVCRFHFQNKDQNQKPNVQEIACTPNRKYISGQDKFFLQSNKSVYPIDSRDYKHRYRNFNTIFKSIDSLCKNGFPTWPNKYPDFPLIFWQPSNQIQIQDALRKLMSPECQKKHNRTLSGIALASNIDPEMFEVGMRVTTNKPFSSPWKIDEQKIFVEDAVNMMIERFGPTRSEENSFGGQLAIYTEKQKDSKREYFLSIFNYDPVTFQVILENEVQLDREVKEIRGTLDKVILVSQLNRKEGDRHYDALLQVYDRNLKPQRSIQVPNFICSNSDGGLFFYMTVSSNPSILQTYKSDANLENITQYNLPVELSTQKVQSIQSMIVMQSQKREEYYQFVFGDINNQTWASEIRNSQEHSSKILTYGTNSRVSRNRDCTMLLLLENSYTHGGILLNNNGQNTCLYHKYDNLKPLATIPHLVNGIETTVQDLISFLQDNSDEIITACHPKISFSKFLNGAQTNALRIWQRYIIATKMVPITDQDFMGAVFSGGSNFQPQLKNKKGFLLISKTQGQGLKSVQIQQQ